MVGTAGDAGRVAGVGIGKILAASMGNGRSGASARKFMHDEQALAARHPGVAVLVQHPRAGHSMSARNAVGNGLDQLQGLETGGRHDQAPVRVDCVEVSWLGCQPDQDIEGCVCIAHARQAPGLGLQSEGRDIEIVRLSGDGRVDLGGGFRVAILYSSCPARSQRVVDGAVAGVRGTFSDG